MGFLKKEKRTAVSVQTQGGYPPVLPVTAGERALYRALREQVPIIDAAIYKLVRLIGGFEVYCPEKHTENALRGFLKTVPVNGCNMGIDNFLSAYFEQLLTYGNAIGVFPAGHRGDRDEDRHARLPHRADGDGF